MRERIAIALGVALVAGTLAVVLSSARPRLASSNSEYPIVRALRLPVGTQRCSGDLVTSGAASMLIWAGTDGPLTRLDVSAGAHGRVAPVRRVYVGRPMRPRALPLGLRTPRGGLAVVCVRNAGPAAAVVGSAAAPNWTSRRSTGARPPGMRVDVYRRGSESGFEIAGVAVARAGLLKSVLIAPWVVWAMLGAVLLAAVAAVRLVVRAGDSA